MGRTLIAVLLEKDNDKILENSRSPFFGVFPPLRFFLYIMEGHHCALVVTQTFLVDSRPLAPSPANHPS